MMVVDHGSDVGVQLLDKICMLTFQWIAESVKPQAAMTGMSSLFSALSGCQAYITSNSIGSSASHSSIEPPLCAAGWNDPLSIRSTPFSWDTSCYLYRFTILH